MRWIPLSTLLPLAFAIGALLTVGGLWWSSMTQQMTQIEQVTIDDLIHDGHIAASHLEYAFAHHDEHLMEKEIALLSSHPSMDWVALVSPEGRVLAASRLAWIGRPLASIPPGEAPGIERLRGQAAIDGIRLAPDRLSVQIRKPVMLPTAPGKLRADRPAWLLGSADLARSKRIASAFIQREMVSIAFVLLLIAAALLLVLHHGVTRRMQFILSAAHRLANGDLDARSGIRGQDEIGEIGRAFDAMAEAIETISVEAFKMRRAIESMHEAVIITDAAGRIEYVNPAFVRMSGWAFHEAVGERPSLLKSEMHPPEFYAEIWRTLHEGRPWHGRIVNRRKDGTTYTVETSITPIFTQHGEIAHFVAVEEDISKRVEAEEKLAQAQKMESIGTLVGGIAHDFNNMLAGMIGNLYLAKKRAAGDERALQLLGRVEALGQRAAEMIQQLLAFARADNVSFRRFDLNGFIREAWRLAQVSVPENINACLDIEDAPMPIEGDMTQIQQMLMNLLANARDALKDCSQPRITISLRIVVPDDVFLEKHRLKPGRYARLSVVDNGEGIKQGDLDRIFEPFYTTKPVGEGSGLGLAMIYGAIQRHGGTIEASSQESGGARFDLWFPLVDETETEARETAPQEERADGELILLADDEPVVLETVAEVLRENGWRVETARDGREALELFASKPKAWHAVLLDVVMPRLGGVAAAQEMRKLRPDVPIVFATGYDREHVLGDMEGLQGVATLSKPVHPAELQKRLREVTGDDPAPSDDAISA
ncbi:MAG: PAS domain S-box protein [Mariprofundaceae bacterium]